MHRLTRKFVLSALSLSAALGALWLLPSNHSHADSAVYLYPWVDQINVRKQPGLAGKPFVRLREGKRLLRLRPSRGPQVTVTLRCQKKNTGFVKVRTPQGRKGWVYRGALSRSRRPPVHWEAVIAYYPRRAREVSEDWNIYTRRIKKWADTGLLYWKEHYKDTRDCLALGEGPMPVGSVSISKIAKELKSFTGQKAGYILIQRDGDPAFVPYSRDTQAIQKKIESYMAEPFPFLGPDNLSFRAQIKKIQDSTKREQAKAKRDRALKKIKSLLESNQSVMERFVNKHLRLRYSLEQIRQSQDLKLKRQLNKIRASGYRLTFAEGRVYVRGDTRYLLDLAEEYGLLTPQKARYSELVYQEVADPSLRDGAVVVSWDKLADRVYRWGLFVQKWPRYKDAMERYRNLLVVFLSGSDNTSIVGAPGSGRFGQLKKGVRASYKRFASKYSDFRDNKLFQEYWKLWHINDFQMNSDIIRFQRNLRQRIK